MTKWNPNIYKFHHSLEHVIDPRTKPVIASRFALSGVLKFTYSAIHVHLRAQTHVFKSFEKMLVNVFQNKSVYKVPIILKDEKFNFPFKNQQTLIIINKAISEKLCE